MTYNNSQITALIIAGGKSTRMGADKALMFGGVERIRQLCIECGVQQIITLCGGQERVHLFEGEVWPDPVHCQSLSEVIRMAKEKIDGPIQFIACDAFDLDVASLNSLLQSGGGVPLDLAGKRQPLLANCPADYRLGQGKSINSLFEKLATLDIEQHANKFSNYNDKSQLKSRR